MTPADATARYIAMHGYEASRRHVVPRARPPTLIESAYAEHLVAIVRELRAALQPLFAELAQLLHAARTDEADLPRVRRLGLSIAIENEAGSIRRWRDRDGNEGSTVMRWPYGYIEGIRGADGEDVDAYIGPEHDPAWIFVVHQHHPATGAYDEDKAMIGWPSADAAKAAYLAQYDDSRFFGGMSTFSRDAFVDRLLGLNGEAITHRLDDSTEGRRLRVLIDRGRVVLVRVGQSLPFVAQRYAEQTAAHHKRELAKQTKAALGVEVPTLDRALQSRIGHFVSENTAAVRALGEKTLGDVERLVVHGFTTNQPANELEAELERRFRIAENRARRLARDHVVRLNAQVARARHKELGVAVFRWRTRGDNLVRPHHAVKHDRLFPYEGSRAPSFMPGDEPGCRCEEIPVFDEIRMKAGIGKGRRRVA